LSYTLPAVLVLILFRLDSVVSLFVFAILLGIMGAGKATLWPLIVNDCFGERSYATVMGFLMMFYTLGAAIGPPLAGYVFDTTGSYYRVFLFSIGAFLLSGVAMAIGSRPRAGNSKG
jgi:MFS family permease